MNKPQQMTIQALETIIDSLRDEIEMTPDELVIHNDEVETIYGFVSFYILFKVENYGDEEISQMKGIFIEKTGMVIQLNDSSFSMWQDIYLGIPELASKAIEDVPYLSKLTNEEMDFIK